MGILQSYFMEYLIVFISYILGSLPSGYFIVKYYSNKDIRTIGSKSIGATNVGRVLGRKGFILTFVIDFTKAFLFIYLIIILGISKPILELSVLAIVIGHIFPIFLKFRGGKGIAITIGSLLAYNYILLLILVILSLILYLFIRKFTISGLFALLILPAYNMIFVNNNTQLYLLLGLNIIITIAHKENLRSYILDLRK